MNPALKLSALADPEARQIEIVERKGLGHPDTICDALAEELSCALSRFYRDRFGFVLHHNVDKVLLWGGSSAPVFGGGEILAPIEIFLAGRATRDFKGVIVPVDEIAVETTRAWLRRHLRLVDPERDVRIHCLVRPGSADLVDLFLRQRESGIWLANDTSIGVGYAPDSALETAVMTVERELNAPITKQRHPAFGEDIKVMGVRRLGEIDMTVSCAMISRHLRTIGDYRTEIAHLGGMADAATERVTGRRPQITVNAADDPARGSIYLTVTGTSAEAGDDGEAGRGNRVSGLITPHRPMTMESVAGKNPITHVGKLYNVAARRIAAAIVAGVPGIVAAECYLVSRIGHPVREPQLIELRVCDRINRPLVEVRPQLEEIVASGLQALDSLWQAVLDRELALY